MADPAQLITALLCFDNRIPAGWLEAAISAQKQEVQSHRRGFTMAASEHQRAAHRLMMSMPSWYAISAAAMIMVLPPVVPSQLNTR